MIDTHMSMQLSGGNGGEASSGPNASSRRQSSDRRLSIGIGHTSNTSLLLHDTDHALSRFQQLRDETNLLTESMQLGHALSSSQHPSQLVGASGLPPPSTSTISSISSMATTGRGRPTSRHSFTNLILPHRRTPSNGSINSERTPGPIIRHSRANTLEGDSDQPSSSLPFASSIPPASEPVSNEPLSTAPDSPSMACAPLLAIADRPFLADDLPVPLADEAMNDSPMNPNTHVRRMSLVTRVPNTGLSLEDASITNTDEQPDNSLLSQPSREFGGNSLEDDGMIFGLADLSFGERSAGSGGAVGPHRPPHW
ncbi:hypothetical protein BDF19DRAFT_314268 [Syncephalis fuscata]|nr:hypothetical protein BDF19DRAFT_314268 [Syncephalis fuscata]